nr:hypothetical protein [Tanacetum cinerariifolium]
MQSGIAEREQRLAHNALHDGLTGLPNRALVMERLGSAVTAQRPVALLYLGIDNFRAINDSIGPEGVEQLLQVIGQQLQLPMRPGDTVARFIGIAVYPASGDSPSELLQRAAIARQDAAQLPGRLQVYEDGRDLLHQRQISLIRDLRHAARNGELTLHYQPKLDIRNGR